MPTATRWLIGRRLTGNGIILSLEPDTSWSVGCMLLAARESGKWENSEKRVRKNKRILDNNRFSGASAMKTITINQSGYMCTPTHKS